MTKVEKQVQDVIDRAVRNEFAGASLVRLDVSRDQDFDCDSIFYIFVVLNDEFRPRPTSLTDLIRNIGSHLGHIDESAFPMVRVVTKRDSQAILNGSR